MIYHRFTAVKRFLVLVGAWSASTYTPLVRLTRRRSYGAYVDRHRVQVALARRGSNFVKAEVVKASSYDVHFRLPARLPVGDYDVYLHNVMAGRRDGLCPCL